MDIFSRLRDFVKYKGISNNEFGRTIGCSSAQITQMLTNQKNFGIDKLLKIFSIYPELNIIWLLTGNGDMISNTNGPPPLNYNNECKLCKEKDKQIETLQRLLSSQEELIELLKEKCPTNEVGQKKKQTTNRLGQ